jgi:hypothetical protein
MAPRVVGRPARRRLLAIGLLLAIALVAVRWAFSTLLEPANLLQMVRIVSLC